MNIKINPDSFGCMFALPADVADKHLKLCSEVQLKVLIMLMRSGASKFSVEQCAAYLNVSQSSVTESLIYWQSRGILLSEHTDIAAQKTESKAAVVKQSLPTRQQVAERMSQSREIAELLRLSEQKFGRLLRQNEMATLVHLCDDEGMQPAVLLMLIEHAVSEGRCSISFIERTAVQWINKGIHSVADAEREMVDVAARKSAWSIVCRAFGTDRRQPSQKEQEAADRWVNQWGFSTDMLRLAYDRCVDAKGKVVISYINAILESWHKSGFVKPADVADSEQKREDNSKKNQTSFDLSLFDQSL